MAADLTKLNQQQIEAIMESVNNNIVLLASAGSGKTTTLIKRTEYLIDDLHVQPENIMLVTFTNKAAGEIKDRMSAISSEAGKMWTGTFHRICVKILRMFGDYMGINTFTILDDKAKKKLIRQLSCKSLDNGDVAKVLKKISSYKANLINPNKVLNEYCSSGSESYEFAALYQDYQNATWKNKTFDFDDLIIYTILLINSYKDIADWIHENIKYITIDESQDMSTDQFTLVRLLVGDNNIMCVGDYSQSIYGFRNAKPEYLDNFVNMFPNTKVMYLQTNYRSTGVIVEAANAVIEHNTSGTKIDMETANTRGAKIGFHHIGFNYKDAQQAEALWVCSEIVNLVTMGLNTYGDFAIINRTNLQNKDIEEVLRNNGVPYSVVGSSSFWGSVEMRDMLAYCKVFINPNDVDSYRRVLGITEGVGAGAAEKIFSEANSTNKTITETLMHIVSGNIKIPRMQKKAIPAIKTVIDIFNDPIYSGNLSTLIRSITKLTQYCGDHNDSGFEEKNEKVNAIIKVFQEFEKDGSSIEEVLDKASLMSDAKGAEKAELDSVKIMTAHACKGLEFDTVFVCGAEENTFPHYNALNISKNKNAAIEEERRLFYVAITRAKRKLYISACGERNGCRNAISRFVSEIPKHCIESVY